ncbi:neurogenic locus notch [Legionella dresdenensis]|uniref:Neurogenic locus notch n=1 Tax=Legionella dresdenensis TaxID=450200 RepID=A0ABV8CHY7_9GAMM
MSLLIRLFVICTLLFTAQICEAGRCGGCTGPKCENPCEQGACCQAMGGIQYCDSSAGRFVCNNGYYSSCYCTRHAIMDLQNVQGCCLWQGGVMIIDPTGMVICNNGAVSEVCTLQSPPQPVASF